MNFVLEALIEKKLIVKIIRSILLYNNNRTIIEDLLDFKLKKKINCKIIRSILLYNDSVQ